MLLFETCEFRLVSTFLAVCGSSSDSCVTAGILTLNLRSAYSPSEADWLFWSALPCCESKLLLLSVVQLVPIILAMSEFCRDRKLCTVFCLAWLRNFCCSCFYAKTGLDRQLLMSEVTAQAGFLSRLFFETAIWAGIGACSTGLMILGSEMTWVSFAP